MFKSIKTHNTVYNQFGTQYRSCFHMINTVSFNGLFFLISLLPKKLFSSPAITLALLQTPQTLGSRLDHNERHKELSKFVIDLQQNSKAEKAYVFDLLNHISNRDNKGDMIYLNRPYLLRYLFFSIGYTKTSYRNSVEFSGARKTMKQFCRSLNACYVAANATIVTEPGALHFLYSLLEWSDFCRVSSTLFN